MDGNKRTAFLIENEYSEPLGLRGLQPDLSKRDIGHAVATWVTIARGDMNSSGWPNDFHCTLDNRSSVFITALVTIVDNPILVHTCHTSNVHS